jgi:hypothetical protein
MLPSPVYQSRHVQRLLPIEATTHEVVEKIHLYKDIRKFTSKAEILTDY